MERVYYDREGHIARRELTDALGTQTYYTPANDTHLVALENADVHISIDRGVCNNTLRVHVFYTGSRYPITYYENFGRCPKIPEDIKLLIFQGKYTAEFVGKPFVIKSLLPLPIAEEIIHHLH